MMKIFREISRLPEFDKDMRRLLKRFKTLEDDLKIFIKNELNLYHKIGIDNKGVFQVPGLKIESPMIYKAKKFACRSLKGRGVQSGIRVIYTYFEEQDKIELIEIYHKGDKENEDRERILKHYAC
jgi:mRNA-degrading endonuclease RelE of RelBE toxin-antitoxin system